MLIIVVAASIATPTPVTAAATPTDTAAATTATLNSPAGDSIYQPY